MVELNHLSEEVSLDREFFHWSLVYQIYELLLDAGENVEHRVAQLHACIAHFNLKVGLEILAFAVQLFASLSDVVKELEELLVGRDLHGPSTPIKMTRSKIEEQTSDSLQDSLLFVKDVLDYAELLFILNLV